VKADKRSKLMRIAETTKMHFNGKERHEWPEFATSFLSMGADEGGWDEALEMQLDLEVADNKRLNKMAWCYSTIPESSH